MNSLRMNLIKNILFLGILVSIVLWLRNPLTSIFQTNMVVNGAILSVLSIGIAHTFYQFYLLRREQQWFASFEQGRERFPGVPNPRILAPLASFAESKETHLNAFNRQALLNSIEARLDELRTSNRYLVGLLIFLGLLGTFWGLSQTIGAIAGVVSNIDVSANDIKEAFQALKQGLQSPLKGMGTAFSSSMFGLGSSLILGFLDLQVGKTFQHFYQWLEEKMLGLGEHTVSTTPQHHGAAYSQGMLEQTAENLSSVVQALHYHHENRLSVIKAVQHLGDKLEGLTDVLNQQKKQLEQLHYSNEQTQETLKYLAAQMNPSALVHTSEKIAGYLEGVDSNIARLLEESIQGRQQLTHEIRSEIRMVAKTISALASNQEEAA